MRSYFDRVDDHGNERFTLIPEPSLRDMLTMSLVHDTTERARIEGESLRADFILDRQDAERSKKLDEALEELRTLLEEGEEGRYPGKVVAVAEFCRKFR